MSGTETAIEMTPETAKKVKKGDDYIFFRVNFLRYRAIYDGSVRRSKFIVIELIVFNSTIFTLSCGSLPDATEQTKKT